MKKTGGRCLTPGVRGGQGFLVLAVALFFGGLAASPSAAVEGIPDTCDESLGLGRVAQDGDACVILDSIIVRVASGYTVDQAAEAVEQLAGWTVTARLYQLGLLTARYAPDTLTLAQLDAQRAAIAALPWAEYVDRDGVAWAAHLRPEGALENPGPGSFQSGIGMIWGWVCDAAVVALEIDGGPPIEAAVATERADTAMTCGDTTNGFGLLFNWNLLGDGAHTVVARADGVEFARATFTVTTLGDEFVQGARGECLVTDFPSRGEAVRLEWQQTQQNFVIVPLHTASSPPAGYVQSHRGR